MKRRYISYLQLADRLDRHQKRAKDPLDKERKENNEKEMREALNPIFQLLLSIGIDGKDLDELLKDREIYKIALPHLLHFVELSESIPAKLKINSLLGSYRWGTESARLLIREFTKDANKGTPLGWQIADTLVTTTNEDNLLEILNLFRSKEYGSDRQMLALALTKIGKNKREVVKH